MNIFNDKQMDESYEPKGNDELTINAVNWLAHREAKVSKIEDVRKLADDTDVVVEGTVTTGAGVFFDAFNLQDETGGIMAFQEVPDGSLKPGDKVRVYGHIKTFDNNKELEFTSFSKDVIKIGTGEPLEPKVVPTGEATSAANQGLLVKVKGKVVSKFDENSYVINDGSGDVLVFTDGYIVNQSNVPVPVLAEGDTLEAVGLSGEFAQGTRIRVRDTKELKKTESSKPSEQPSTGGGSSEEQPSTGGGSSEEQPSTGGGSSEEQPSTGGGSSEEQPSTGGGSSEEQPSTGGGSSEEQPSTGGGSSEEQPSTGGGSSEEQPSTGGGSSEEQPSTGGGSSEEQPSTGGGSSEEQPSTGGGSSEEQPSTGGGSSEEQPSTGGGSSEEQPSTGGGSSEEQPSTGGGSSEEQPSTGGGSSEEQPSTGGGSSEEQPSTPEPPKVDKDGGIVFNDDLISNNNGKTQVDEKKVLDAINSAKETINKIEIQIKGDTSNIFVPVNTLKTLKDKNNEAVLEIKNEAASYKLPMKELDLKGNVSNVEILVQKVETPKELKDKQVTTVAPVIEFTVNMTIDGKEVKMEQFNHYVSREIVTDKPFNKDKAVAVRINKDGSLTVIPTVFNGNTAIIKSMTNSMYTIIEMDKTFNDVNNGASWAEEFIEKLASKGIIYGKSETNYEPNTSMTRGEFAALISRSLALTPKGAWTGPFKDVPSQMAVNKNGEIGAAWEAGIIQGKTKDTFDPNAKITRAEAAAMISRAMNFVTFDAGKLMTSKKITTYQDKASIPEWASKDIEKMLQADIMIGDSNGKFNPHNPTTRAEMAKIIANFMQFVEMMN